MSLRPNGRLTPVVFNQHFLVVELSHLFKLRITCNLKNNKAYKVRELYLES